MKILPRLRHAIGPVHAAGKVAAGQIEGETPLVFYRIGQQHRVERPRIEDPLRAVAEPVRGITFAAPRLQIVMGNDVPMAVAFLGPRRLVNSDQHKTPRDTCEGQPFLDRKALEKRPRQDFPRPVSPRFQT